MIALKTSHLGTALAGLSLLFAAGCASPQTLRQYQDEVRSLREERTALKKENRDLRMQNEAYEVALAEANARPAAMPVGDQGASSFDDITGVNASVRGGNLVISIESSVTFSSGRATLTKQGEGTLRAVADILRSEHPQGEYWIEGHTDSDPITKSKWASNRELSMARAMAVLHYLVESCDVEDEDCVVAGHGQYEPVSDNASKEGKSRNRRVEIVVHRKS